MTFAIIFFDIAEVKTLKKTLEKDCISFINKTFVMLAI